MMDAPVLLIVDAQKGFNDSVFGESNDGGSEERMKSLLDLWRIKKLPVVHIQHSSKSTDSPFHPGAPGFAFREGFEPETSEVHIIKHVNSAFVDTTLHEYLTDHNLSKLIIVGYTVPHCISTTARMAGNLGYKVSIVHDAAVSFALKSYDGSLFSANMMHESSLAALHGEFAEILPSADARRMIAHYRE